MKINLLLTHEMLITDDHLDVVNIQPPHEGVLLAGDARFCLENGSPVPKVPNCGRLRVSFITSKGVGYAAISPIVKDGILYSEVDFIQGYTALRIYIDELERRMESLAVRVRALEAMMKPDALGFMIHNTRNTESGENEV